ncbi:MAG: hypothetical protein ACJAVM_002136 [Sulfitobacter sp.]|jgi:hypothetical protein
MDEFDKYKNQLRARISQLIERIEEGSATKDYVAFETFWSIFSAFEDGRTHEDIKDAYPLENWREDTVTIPRAIARRLAEGWGEYRSSDSSKTLGNAFNLEGGQGKSPVNKTNRNIDREKWRSNQVAIRIIEAELTEGSIKKIAIFHEVAELEFQKTGKKIKPDTVKAAFQEHGQSTLQAFREKHFEEYRGKLREVSNPTS